MPEAQQQPPMGGVLADGDSPMPHLAARGVVGGALMGLANLVPGISGGTMLLAAGVYPGFINGVAEVTTLRFRTRSIVLLCAVAVAAATAILLFAGPVKDLVVQHRWAMYSLFIGLTLGGVPVVRRLIRRPDNSTWVGASVGFLGMAALAAAQQYGSVGTGSGSGMLLFFLAGIVGASAMILPGVSGGYLLLVLGVYVPILGAIHAVKEALKAGDVGALVDPVLSVVVPVGIGVVVGIASVSNVLRWLLLKHENLTLGALLGLLIGAVVGLFPFQQGERPVPGDVVKGRELTAEMVDELDLDDWPTSFFTPTPAQVGGSLGLAGAGFLVTLGVAWIGRDRETQEAS